MKIKQIDIHNFRSIEKEIIKSESYNVFVGPNGSGKSTVLNALNVFFGEITKFTESDFHKRDTSKVIEITVTFMEFSQEAEEEFKHYIRNDELVVSVEISKDENGKFKKTVKGERLIFKPLKSFFELPKSPAGPRAKIFKELKESFPEIENASSDPAREKALREYEESLPESEKELAKSGGEFFGVSKGVHKFQKHINWVYVPAVKDASVESEEAKTSHLGRLIQHTIRSGMDYDAKLQSIKDTAMSAYEGLLDGQKSHLETLEKNLSDRLKTAVTSDARLELNWKRDEKSVSILDPTARVLLQERGFSGEVENFGHGLQRSFLIVILQELMTFDSTLSPTLILGCEEPELYQHPPQAKHLSSILTELTNGDAQVFLTTHSPYFIDVEYFDGIKKFQNTDGRTTVSFSNFSSILENYNTAFSKPVQNEDQIRAKLSIHTQPKFNEIFFSDKVVLVEGISDQTCLKTYLKLSNKNPEFQKSGISILVCEGKSSLVLLLLIANSFNIPNHVVFDCDSGVEEQYLAAQIKDNGAIFNQCGITLKTDFPTSHVLEKNITAWTHDIEEVLNAEFGTDVDKYKDKGRQAVGHLGSCEKNPIFVATVMSEAWNDGKTFPTLEAVISNILL